MILFNTYMFIETLAKYHKLSNVLILKGCQKRLYLILDLDDVR